MPKRAACSRRATSNQMLAVIFDPGGSPSSFDGGDEACYKSREEVLETG